MTTHPPAHWAGFPLDRPLVMGILNVTPDSFSDGGKHAAAADAIEAGRAMLAAGVDIIDVGGESTRPNAALLPPAEEIARVRPVIEALAQDGAVISVDTRNAATMEAALKAGARIINDISGLKHDPRAAALGGASRLPGGADAYARHAADHGRPDAVRRMCSRTCWRNSPPARDAALKAGIRAENIALDPGFGFAKTNPPKSAPPAGHAPFRRPRPSRC